MPVPSDKGKKQTCTLLVLGQEGHGRTTLTAAIDKLLATKTKNKATPLDEIQSPDQQTVKGEDGDKLKLNFNKVQIDADKRTLILYDFPNHSEFIEFATKANEHYDGAILVVDAVEGVGDETKPQLEAIRNNLKGKNNLIVFLNKTDLAEDKDQVDLTELTVKNILTELELDTDKTLFFRGSASNVMESNDRKTSKPLLDLMKGVNKLPAH